MGRRKQARPHRSGGIILDSGDTAEAELDKQKASEPEQAPRDEFDEAFKPYFVEIDRSSWVWDEHLDISEVVLTGLNLREGFSCDRLKEDFYQDSKYSLRFRVCNVNESVSRIKLGHWPVLSASDISLELIEKRISEEMETNAVILSGNFDGPDEGVTGLVHLVSLNFMTLRPVLGVTFSADRLSLRFRAEILKSAFDACESLLENVRQLWKKSMMNVMAWLRPEVSTSEAKYGVSTSTEMDIESHGEMGDTIPVSRKPSRFDVAWFYEAIKPSKGDLMLEDDIPDLLPQLRPYQRRAAYWMVQREKGVSGSLGERERSQVFSPLCVPVDFVDTCSKMFYNPFSGNVSMHPEYSLPYVFGGILADEMGLGKTVELLACVFTHQKSGSEEGIYVNGERQVTGDQKINLKRLKRERVECICGAVSENRRYKGLWIQCDICDAWQHADCVGYKPAGKPLKSREVSDGGHKVNSTVKLPKDTRKKSTTSIIMMDGEYICQLCSELMKATDSPVATGATLIVCPAPILPQWHAEIIRHTNPGSLKICIYEGVRNNSPSNASTMDISELVSSDIVLTTYDVFREDLSHDSDRHEGDQRCMRFQKRYPVIPTLLTRISWWRICLDEAQMVENNAAAAADMALRLDSKHRWCITGTPIQRKLDDLYGLLKFLKAGPFDVPRWWNAVIRDPYERRDAGAMEFAHKFFKQIMWRSSKLHVADELQLPPQEECISWLSFSPIEEHFYQRQHETCVSHAHEVIESLKDDILKRNVPGSMSVDAADDYFISHMEAAKLLNSLLKLRQACCHPQVGSSGLRSLQQSPLTMEEILMVLVGKTKTEGEEALRMLVIALNALAAIAMIEKNPSKAVSLYKEALSLAEEHSEDLRLDPLLNIHIHHNLAEILPVASECSQKFPSRGEKLPGSPEKKVSEIHTVEKCDQTAVKRRKVTRKDSSDINVDIGKLSNCTNHQSASSLTDDKESCSEAHILRTACENMKQKYLSVFSSKLSLAQQDFRKSYAQVCDAFTDRKNQHTVWWLEALHHFEQDKDLSSELIRKIGEAVSGALNNSKSSRIASCFRNMSGLKYRIQTGLDLLEESRRTLLNQLLEIDQTMENPREEDIERVRYCPNCQFNGDGPTCVHCELDELFQAYAARLFRLKGAHGGMDISAEEAVDLQKKNFELNRFIRNLSQPSKGVDIEETNKKRDVGDKVVVSRSPSELEVVLVVIKSHCKAQLGKEGKSEANKQLLLLEGMRKEYTHARSLAIAQAQFLRAHDEIKMATSRLRLRENENDKSVDALSIEELAPANVLHSGEKFMFLTLLSRTKGKLHYLKGLVQSKQKLPLESPNSSTLTQETATIMTSPSGQKNECLLNADEETCPVCQEMLSNQKMVFQCGHVTCCKCLFAMTEHRLVHDGKFRDNWVMCPTCRQHTDFGNIAYADDRQNKSCDSPIPNTIQGCEMFEASIPVQGSYGTKIEAVTRRILWIKSTAPKEKVLVFSNWNDVLDVLEHAFAANCITYVRMKGGRKSQVAISQFRGQKNSSKGTRKIHGQQTEPNSVQVLLLLIQHGANGLNLLEAQHVVLVEPLLNPAAEAQAISRVHRIGQKDRTLVHRFLVKGTVEESLYKLNRSRNTNTFISGNTKNQDQPVLTLKDIESLFAAAPPTKAEVDEESRSLMHLSPSMAAAIAAERRLKESITSSSL